MKASLIMPVYKRSDLTMDFINNISAYLDENTELIIIDNNSQDNTLNFINVARRNLPHLKLRLISNYENMGFGKANNLGVSLAKSENIIFISNDVQVLGDIVTPIVSELEKNNKLAIGPRLIKWDTGWNNFDRFGVIGYLEGFCLATTKQNLAMVGGFDPNIFIDYEDVDLSLRLHLAGVGLKQITLPVVHQGGASFKNLPQARLDYTMQSLRYLEEKWQMKKISLNLP